MDNITKEELTEAIAKGVTAGLLASEERKQEQIRKYREENPDLLDLICKGKPARINAMMIMLVVVQIAFGVYIFFM